MEKYLAGLLTSVVFCLLAVLPAAGEAVLLDDFTNGIPLENDGIGADWTVASSYGDSPHTPHSETGTEVKLYDGSGGWNVSGIKNGGSYAAGSTVQVALTGIGGVTAGSTTYNRGNGLATAESASVNIADYLNAEAFPNTYTNGGLAGISIEINYAPSTDSLGYMIFVSGMSMYTDSYTHAGVFDAAASSLSLSNPLIVEATPMANGTCTVGFNWSYNSGSTDTIATTLSGSGTGLLSDNTFILALGAQGIGSNNGWVSVDSCEISEVPEPSAIVLIAMGLLGLFCCSSRKR